MPIFSEAGLPSLEKARRDMRDFNMDALIRTMRMLDDPEEMGRITGEVTGNPRQAGRAVSALRQAVEEELRSRGAVELPGDSRVIDGQVQMAALRSLR